MLCGYLCKTAPKEHFLALRTEALQFAMEASARAYPQVFARFGPRGREACAEDMTYHLDFLRPTLETGDTAPFVAYLAWLSQVLRSRSVPTESLTQSLGDFSTFFAQALGSEAAPLAASLSGSRHG